MSPKTPERMHGFNRKAKLRKQQVWQGQQQATGSSSSRKQKLGRGSRQQVGVAAASRGSSRSQQGGAVAADRNRQQ